MQAQNIVAERKHIRIIEMVQTFLILSLLPFHFELKLLSSYFYYKSAARVGFGNQSPFEKLFSLVPDYTFLCTFGCKCFPNFAASSADKL